MRLPRVRFTLRRLMVAVALVGAVLGMSRRLYLMNLASDLRRQEQALLSNAANATYAAELMDRGRALGVPVPSSMLRAQAAEDRKLAKEHAARRREYLSRW